MLHTSVNSPAGGTDRLAAELDAARRRGVPWKDLEGRYGLGRARLYQILAKFRGYTRCACPSCGHQFDPKPHRIAVHPGRAKAQQPSAKEEGDGTSRTQAQGRAPVPERQGEAGGGRGV